LSPGDKARGEEAWRMQLAAGPQLHWKSASDGRTQQQLSPMLQFALKPQHSAKISIAGYSVFTNWDRSVSAAERQGDDSKGSGISTGGWVGIALSTAAAVGGVLLLTDSETCISNPVGCDGPQCPPPCLQGLGR
jgi:hypothetical protein